eukprot:gene12994-15285_t
MFGFSPFMVSLSNYFGDNVYPSNYQHGVEMSFYANAAQSAASFLFALALPSIITALGVRAVYSVSQVIAGTAFILFLVVPPSFTMAIILTVSVSINFCCFNSIPYALMTQVAPSNQDIGVYFGAMSDTVIIAQTISIFTAGRVEAYRNQNSAWAIAYGGIFSLIGGLVAWTLPTKRNDRYQLINDTGKEEEQITN